MLMGFSLGKKNVIDVETKPQIHNMLLNSFYNQIQCDEMFMLNDQFTI